MKFSTMKMNGADIGSSGSEAPVSGLTWTPSPSLPPIASLLLQPKSKKLKCFDGSPWPAAS